MAYPFLHVSGLRQRLLLAIGTTTFASAAALGCGSKHTGSDAGVQAGESAPAPSAGKAGTNPPAGGAGRSTVTPDAGSPTCPNNQVGRRECYTRADMEAKAKFGCGQIQIQPVPTAEQVQAMFLSNGCLKHETTCNGCCNPAAGPGEPQGDGSCCYSFCATFCCGRPLRIDGEARTASLAARSDWLHDLGAVQPNARIAAEWLEDARMEHASVASFARFTLDLLAFGAPAELIERAQRAGLEEVEHARLCFGLAARYSAQALGPAPLSAAGIRVAPSLWDAALAAFDEGCVAETLAALQAHAAFELARDSEVRRALQQIAEQEAQHAELAWRFVGWCAARLGSDLHRELERRLGALAAPAAISDSEPQPTIALLHAAGRLTAADKHRISTQGVRDVIAPCLAALARPEARVARPTADTPRPA
ncbi:MAG TPA: ferritin-like domain-containing protein [Polyangiales bacterium]|nr:ferritin-like domain-containing protein [Polyangiales bacterium]